MPLGHIGPGRAFSSLGQAGPGRYMYAPQRAGSKFCRAAPGQAEHFPPMQSINSEALGHEAGTT